tara:strand:+ start:41 stop:811 length:771 start_codon:yes stop_codon:yes gene_type:complete
MAIGINNVYQKVLALANKEQRGYITPQEFNLFADQAQMEIFEQYFYDLEQRQRAVGNEFDYADMVNSIEEKISVFEINNKQLSIVDNIGNVDVSSSVLNMYKLGSVAINYPVLGGGGYEDIYYPVEQIQIKELNLHRLSPLKTFSKKRPVYVKYHEALVPIKLQIYPHPSQSSIVSVNYIRRPSRPNWTYVLSGNNAKNALYNSSANDHQDFELHISEENNLVVKILQLAGIAIKDFGLAQAAGQKEVNTIQQQKQ